MGIRAVLTLSALAALLVAPGSAAAAAATPGTVHRLSLSGDGAPAQSSKWDELASRTPSVSGDGRFIAFDSNAVNLTPGDTNDAGDVFIRDRITGSTILISRAADGQPADGYSGEAVISADGGSVAFVSGATNLVPGDTNGVADIFVRDLRSGSMTRVSVATDGTQAVGGTVRHPSISADGSAVAFASDATNLTADHFGQGNVFVRDLAAGTTTQVNVTDANRPALGDSQSPSISGDGRRVAFASIAPLVKGDTNRTYDVFLRDLTAGTTTRVSLTETGAQRQRPSTSPALSADGQVVAYAGYPEPSGVTGIFVRHLSSTRTSEISVSTGGIRGDGINWSPSISADGRLVTFASTSTNLVPGDTNGQDDIFLRDTALAGTTTRLSVPAVGINAQSNGNSVQTSISADGSYVAFVSYATNLVEDDTTPGRDVFGLGISPT